MSDASDMGPLPSVHDRDVPTRKARNEVDQAVAAVRAKYELSYAELLWVLTSVLHSRAGVVLSAERRQGGRESCGDATGGEADKVAEAASKTPKPARKPLRRFTCPACDRRWVCGGGDPEMNRCEGCGHRWPASV